MLAYQNIEGTEKDEYNKHDMSIVKQRWVFPNVYITSGVDKPNDWYHEDFANWKANS